MYTYRSLQQNLTHFVLLLFTLKYSHVFVCFVAFLFQPDVKQAGLVSPDASHDAAVPAE